MLLDTTSTATARHRLLALRQRDGGWGYHPRTPSTVEASSLAALALLATSAVEPCQEIEATDAARWVAERCRRPDGSTGIAARSAADSPGWTTPFALLLWNALSGFEVERASAVAWLLAIRGKPGQPAPHNPMGHDVTLIGWPWVADTHSWVEPTATALLALAPSVGLDHPRLREGVRVLLDRAIPTGGWNLGNPAVFGKTLRPLPGPTGLALLALRRVARHQSPSSVIDPALAYLRTIVTQTAAPISLGWASLGLRACEAATDPAVATRLAVVTDRVLGRDPSAVELALLLLASGGRSLATLGITDTPFRSHRHD